MYLAVPTARGGKSTPSEAVEAVEAVEEEPVDPAPAKTKKK